MSAPAWDKLRVCTGFWLLGLINNVLYVIILSAALDLVGPNIPKGVVLLADVFPSFLVKLTAPYYIHLVPYRARVVSFVFLSAGGILIIALSPDTESYPSVIIKLLGVVLASLSSGGGELSFLGLTHHYDSSAGIASWSSGTGAAGLVGAGVYVFATTTFGLSSRTSLLAVAFLPVIMLISFFFVLPATPVTHLAPTSHDAVEYQSVPNDDDHRAIMGEEPNASEEITDGLERHPETIHHGGFCESEQLPFWKSFKSNLQRAQKLFLPYMLPLLLVYVAEYTINQGISPTLLFPLKDSPFKDFREFYPAYNAIYQFGVFISRSSTAFFRVHHLYAPSILQVLNLALLTVQSLTNFIPTVWLVFLVIFWEGLLGGLVYVNTFAEISENVPLEDREFSLSATTVSDSGGICIAAFVSMAFERVLCDLQVRHGRDWCRRP